MSKKIKGIITEKNGLNVNVMLEQEIPNNFSEYEVTIQKKSDKRGKDANALSWGLIDRLAKHYESSKNEIYKLMIERYGVSTFLVVKPQEAERILNLLEHGRILGEVTINGKKGVQLQIYIGSSNYNREEFHHYLSGIISECEENGLVIEDKDVFYDSILHWR